MTELFEQDEKLEKTSPVFSKIWQDASEQGLGLLEISKGDGKLLQILVTPNINVEELQKKWCHDYCDAHGYALVED